MPVGEDQQQHLELTRDLEEISNIVALSDASFVAPFKRTPSLWDPTPKMSNSSIDPNSRNLLRLDETIAERVRSAVTDSISGITFDPAEHLGTSNPLKILSACTGEATAVLADRDAESKPGALKKDVVDSEAVERCASLEQSSHAFVRKTRPFPRLHERVQK